MPRRDVLLAPPTLFAAGVAAGAAAALLAGRSPLAVVATAGLAGVLVAVTRIDIRERRIPNAWTYPAILAALLLAAATGNIVLAALGLLICGGYLAVFAFLRSDAMGMGDVKLAALAGAVVGPAGAPLFLVAGTGAGLGAGIVMLLRGKGRRSTLAYGPYLALGALVAVLVVGPVAA